MSPMVRRTFLAATAGMTGAAVLTGRPGAAVAAVTGEPVRLVHRGDARATIRWWGGETARFAAEELRDYLATMSGARLPVRAAVLTPDRLPANARHGVVLSVGLGGTDSVPTDWLRDADAALAPTTGDAFVLISADDRLVLAGRDQRGALYAAYELLERLGVRFFAPTFGFYHGHAEHVPPTGTVEVPPLRVLEQPAWALRRRYVEEGYSHTTQNLPQLIDWMAKQRLNVLVYPFDYIAVGVTVYDDVREAIVPALQKRGITIEVGGHGYDSFLKPSEYPQYYTNDRLVFDLYDDEALATYVDKVIEYLAARPEIAIFDCWPPDIVTFPSAILDHFDGRAANAESHVVNTLAAALRDRLPGVRAERIAYHSTIDPPSAEYASDPDVVVDFAPFTRNYLGPLNDPARPANSSFARRLEQWRESFDGDLVMYEYYRRYRWRSMPAHPLEVIGRDVAYEATVGVQGLGMYSEPADWVPYELVQLLVAALSWNAVLDVPRYVEEYLTDRFGPAAADVAAYYRATSTDPDAYSGPAGVGQGLADYRAAASALDRAAQTATGAGAFVLQRLRWNIEIAIADLEVGWFQLKEPTKVPGAQTRLRNLFTEHRFNGVALPNIQAIRRWGGQAGDSTRPALARIYRGPAYGFADTEVSVPAGRTGSVTVSAQDVDHQGHRVTWSVSEAAGLSVTSADGTLDVNGVGIASQQVTLGVPPGTPTGRRELVLAFRTENRVLLPPATIAVTVT